MRASLDASMVTTGANFGFLRSGARLAVVVLTDEDDCSESATPKNVISDSVCHTAPIDSQYFDPLDGFVDYLDTTVGKIVGEPPIFAVIAGFDANGDPIGCATTAFSRDPIAPRRLSAFVDRLNAAHPGRAKGFSMCQPFAGALSTIAQAIIPQTMPLEQAPADYRMMVVSVQRGATSIRCRMDAAGAAGVASADVVYTPAPPGGLASLTFQNVCKLQPGDKVDIQIICAH